MLKSQKGSIGTLISYLYSQYVQNTIIICWILSKYIFINENIFMVKMIFLDRSWINHDETRWILFWYAICQGLYFNEDVEILWNFIFSMNLSPIPVTKIFVDKVKNAVSYKRVLYRSNAVVTVPIMFLSHYIKRYKIDSMQPNSVLPESKYGRDGEMAQNSKRNWIRCKNYSNFELSQNFRT